MNQNATGTKDCDIRLPVSGVLSGNGSKDCNERLAGRKAAGFQRALRNREQRLQRTASRRKGCRFPESTPETGAKIAANS